MASDKSVKHYKFSGFPFVQKVLTYPEFEEALSLLSQFIDGIENLKDFGSALDKIIKSGLVPHLVRIVIKPHERTLMHKLYYALKRRITKKNVTDPIALMDLEEVVEVMRDFFSINTSSLSGLMLIGTESALFRMPQEPESPSAPMN